MPRSRHHALYVIVGLRLRAAREAKGLTQMEVARALKYQQTYVSKCEKAERRVDVVECHEFALLYGISVLDLVQPMTPAERAEIAPLLDAMRQQRPVDDEDDD